MAETPPLDPTAVLWSAEPAERDGRPLLVLLHGYGADEGDLFALAAHLPARFVVCAVRAPLQPPFPAPGYSWYPIEGLESRSARFVTESAARFIEWVDAATDAHVVGLLGFSQGAAVALQALRLRPDRFAFVVNLSGYATPGELPRDEELARLRPPVFWGRGTHDDVIPPFLVEHSVEWLPAHVDLSGRVYPGLTHSVSEQELADVRTFLELRLADLPLPESPGPRRRMTVREWQTIDAMLDNVVAAQNQSGELARALSAHRLRERGWETARAHPDRDGGTSGWPPVDAAFDIALSDAEVAYLRATVADGTAVTESILEFPALDPRVRAEQEDSLVLGRQALAALDQITRE